MKIWVILRNTYHEIVRQPIFYLLIGIFGALIFLSQYITFFAFGEELSMMKEMAITSTALCGLLLALFASTTVVSDELENKTVLALLTKPVYRSEFILGKFLGIAYAVLLVVLFFSLLFTLTLWMKEGLSSYSTPRDYQKFVQKRQEMLLKDQHFPSITAQERFLHEQRGLPEQLFARYTQEYVQIFFYEELLLVYQGIFLVFIQILLLSSFSLMVSCFFSPFVTVISCFSLFVLGHLWEYLETLLHQFSSLGILLASFLSCCIPNLEYFNLSWAISVQKTIPLSYLFYVTSYGFFYMSLSLILTMVLFQNREVL
jgi:hypothetical protein